jgi:hypothetical protein
LLLFPAIILPALVAVDLVRKPAPNDDLQAAPIRHHCYTSRLVK